MVQDGPMPNFFAEEQLQRVLFPENHSLTAAESQFTDGFSVIGIAQVILRFLHFLALVTLHCLSNPIYGQVAKSLWS